MCDAGGKSVIALKIRFFYVAGDLYVLESPVEDVNTFTS